MSRPALHYTPAEVARLRDEATPGPWAVPDADASDGFNVIVSLHESMEDEAFGPLAVSGEDAEVEADERDLTLMAASWSLADDNLTLHDENAALREQADRMRAVLLGSALVIEAIANGAGPSSARAAWRALDSALGTRGGTLEQTLNALRTLAGEASR